MAQYIKNADTFGRIGTGIGQGLAEQVPKEMERNRLASGLEQLGKQEGLTPFQQFTGLVRHAHEYPQVVQSGTDLLKQQAQAKAFAKANEKPAPYTLNKQSLPQFQGRSNIPSLTKGEQLEEVQKGYIRPTLEQRDARAAQVFNENPDRFKRDPQLAVDWVDNEIATEEKRDLARTAQHERLTGIQDNVVKRLKDQSGRLNVQVPAELYSTIEDEAIQATKPKSEGGRGLSEQQAMKEFGDKLNNASRDFAKIDELGGGWGIALRPAAQTLRSMKEIQKRMEELDQTDNMAKQMISKNNISPMFSYAVSEPIHRVPELNKVMKELPALSKAETLFETLPNFEVAVPATQAVAPRLAKFIKDNPKASPLAVAYELQKKGYDPNTFLQYLTDHPELNLKQRQAEQAATPINVVAPWNDFWLQAFSGIE